MEQKVRRFEDLKVWQKARQLCNDLYPLMNSGTLAKDYGLREQLNRSTGSIMDNIAEGYERDGRQEFVQFLSYSKSSAGEARSQLYRAVDRKHISEETFSVKKGDLEEISRMLAGLIKYYKGTSIRGLKYKVSEDSEFYVDPEPDTNLEP